VAVGERAAFAVLAGEADGGALGEEGAEGEGFAGGPIGGTAGEDGGAGVEETLDLGVGGEVGREAGDALDDGL